MKSLWALLLVMSPSAANAACLHYGPPNVALVGHVVRGHLQTAPGYHAQHHISSDYYWSIETAVPFCLPSGKNDDLTVSDGREAQVWPASPAIMQSLDQFEGETVRITGYFMHTELPHHHSYPIFAVSAIRVVQRVDP
jgi:hypothetical protein